MSDPRFPFQVPAPRDDGPGGSGGGQDRASGRRPASETPQPSWPEPPDGGGRGRRGGGRGHHGDGRDPLGDDRDRRGDERDEEAGEVTMWGYPPYREPAQEPDAPSWGSPAPDSPRNPSGSASSWGSPASGPHEAPGRHVHGAHGSPSGEAHGLHETPAREAHGFHEAPGRHAPASGRGEAPGWGTESPTPRDGWAPSGAGEPWAPSGVEEPWTPAGVEEPWDPPRARAPYPGRTAQDPWAPDAAPRGGLQNDRGGVPDPRSGLPEPLGGVPDPRGAQGTRSAPAGRTPDPLDPAWTPAPAGAHIPAWASAASAPAPPETGAGEQPFSYWDKPQTRLSHWGHYPEADEEPRPVEEPPAPPAKKKREPYLDNVKFVLIALVVTGHSLVPTLAAHSSKAAYLFIYTFHMPAFVLVSGYLGRNFWNSNAKINKLVDTMLVPYAVVELGYALLRFAVGQKWTLTIIDPAWLNWYLLALVLWRISTPIWNRMRQPVLVALVISMVAGFSEISGDFSIDRFFGLLPFYVIGLVLKPEHFDLLKPLWVRITGGIVLAGGAAGAILIAPHVSLKPVYYRYSFKSMDMSWWLGLGVRGAMLLAGLALSVALLAVVPRRRTWFSDLGTRTLYAYLLHGVVVLVAKDQKWLSVPWLYGPLGVIAIASSALVLAIILCLPVTRTAFKWLLEPRLVWLYRRPAGQPTSPPPTVPAADMPAAATPADPAAGPARGESSARLPR
ncbi:acyltransferase family protein [Streptosporangium sp. NPDC048047]|uniref:acyltransferase family protein n=1 Tax=Streptosporangium sp. NPDC048047 TaxID=3155748 RepID=UPI003437FB32